MSDKRMRTLKMSTVSNRLNIIKATLFYTLLRTIDKKRTGTALLLLILLTLCHQPAAAANQPGLIWNYIPVQVEALPGLSFIYHRDRSSSVTTIQLFIKGGRNAEPDGLKGIAELTSKICTGSNSLNMIKLFSLGSSLTEKVENDFIVITITSLSEFLNATLDMVTDVLRKPSINKTNLAGLKSVLLQALMMKADDMDIRIDALYDEILFPGSSSASTNDTAQMLNNISVKDVKKFHKNHVHLSNMVIAVSSEMPRFQMQDIIKKHFKRFPRQSKTNLLPHSNSRDMSVPAKKEHFIKSRKYPDRSLVSMGVPMPGNSFRDYVRAYFLEMSLMGGVHQKFSELRRERSLAYSTGARLIHNRGSSYLLAFLRTFPSKINIAIPSLKAVFLSLYEKGFTRWEFQCAKEFARATFLHSIETKENRTYHLAEFEHLGYGYSNLANFTNHIDELEYEEFNLYLKKVFNPQNLVTVVLAPGGYVQKLSQLPQKKPPLKKMPVKSSPDRETTKNTDAPDLSNTGSESITRDVTALTRAVARYRKLVKKQPKTHLPNLVIALRNLGGILVENGRLEEAETPLKEAVTIIRGLAGKEPGLYAPHLASITQNLGILCNRTGRMQDARTYLAEALQIYRGTKNMPVAATGGVLFDPAVTLTALGLSCSETDQQVDATKYFKEAVSFIQTQYGKNPPTQYMYLLAFSHSQLGEILFANLNPSKDISHFTESVRLFEKLAAKKDDNQMNYEISVCSALSRYSLVLLQLPDQQNFSKNYNKAKAVVKRAITILKKYPDNPRAVKELKRAMELKQALGK
ncbi:MAG: tetratricopeptide repeat protein [bacterium]|nr:tetratricopeptide repeat protein [bacterium]